MEPLHPQGDLVPLLLVLLLLPLEDLPLAHRLQHQHLEDLEQSHQLYLVDFSEHLLLHLLVGCLVLPPLLLAEDYLEALPLQHLVPLHQVVSSDQHQLLPREVSLEDLLPHPVVCLALQLRHLEDSGPRHLLLEGDFLVSQRPRAVFLEPLPLLVGDCLDRQVCTLYSCLFRLDLLGVC